MAKKSFFAQPAAKQIQRRSQIDVSPNELNASIDELRKTDNYILIKGVLVPDSYKSHKKFVKHAPEIIARHASSQSEVMKIKKFPYQLKKEELDRIVREEKSEKRDITDFAGGGFFPMHNDSRKRRILFTTDFEAAQIYTYSFQSSAPILVKPYAEARKVAREGAEIMVEVPSRTQKQDRYNFKLMSVPVIDSPEKFVIAHNLGSTHSCPDTDFRIRYKFENQVETSQIVNLDAHVGAAYLAVIDHYWNEGKNKVPLNCGQFDIPTSNALEFYKPLLSRVLIQESKDHKSRKLDRAEKNIAISDRLKSHGYNWMFFPDKTIHDQVNIRDYNWNVSGED